MTDAAAATRAAAAVRAGRWRSHLAAVRHGINTHVRPGRGVTNTVLNRLAKLACDEDFHGVYSSDCLPFRLTIRPKFVIIVNLAESDAPAGHFVTIAAVRNKVYYLDSFGLGLFVKRVADFVNLCKRPIYTNAARIQDFASVNCGMYALLFAVYLNRKMQQGAAQPWRKPRFRLNFFKKKSWLRKNDKLCFDYLRRLST